MPSVTKRKIINDPVYGFITIQHPLIFQIVEHPFYQRLRRINQMAMAHLVYPGAVHTRLHHSLGAYHLMCNAVTELRAKDVEITTAEEIAVKAAILLHDAGHGPFSHALEETLIPSVHHEELSLLIIEKMNRELNGALGLTLSIFKGEYKKHFLHQLISGQLDMDRMDYLMRDSFFTGVSEGVIGYDRILKMLVVHNQELMVEEKGIYSVEKFLVARRQMYWQVYLHKTVLAAEKMLVKIIERAKYLNSINDRNLSAGPAIDFFIQSYDGKMTNQSLEWFCAMDDTDITFAIKTWRHHPDKVLSLLCDGLLNRRLLKCDLRSTAFTSEELATKRQQTAASLKLSTEEAQYFVFTGEASNTTYKIADENIKILFKNGAVTDISHVDNPLIHQTISAPVKKFYICSFN
ncbi:MAG: deoxyguanosinetriphosphate triphosphohydrolase [Chitinophagaceae bacterium]|nr:deoxyguanosinetriphosphate triphosphohydrolase [Chitinophagaceae bacterium]